MDRLAEQVVAWHNRHPLAKRITIYDVHTIGVVALPFMRGGRAAAPAEPIEPVLTDEVSPESIAAAMHDESTIAANENAARLDALADQEDFPESGSEQPAWKRWLAGLLRRRGKAAGFGKVWPAFSERFVEGLSARAIARFAQDHGFASRPGDETWPQRVVPIDDKPAAAGGDGGWPFELYLMSAAIDAGRSRTRVLVGRGGAKPPVLGTRCWDPKRLGPVLLLPVALVAAALAIWWPRAAVDEPANAAAAAASAAAAAASAAPIHSPALSAMPALAASAASAAASQAESPDSSSSAASTPEAAAAASTAATAAASAPLVDIRPRFVEPARPPGYREAPLRANIPAPAVASASASEPANAASKPAITPSISASGSAPAAAAKAEAAAAPQPGKDGLPSLARRPDIRDAAASGKPVVALVGPPMRNKAEAEALLARMRELVAPMQADPSLMQAQLFQSPEGWRAAVWPFASRAEAQLINATLVARGMRTKAVNF